VLEHLQGSGRPGSEILQPGLQQLDQPVALTGLGGHPDPQQHLGVVLHPGWFIRSGLPLGHHRVVGHVQHPGQVGLAQPQVALAYYRSATTPDRERAVRRAGLGVPALPDR